MLDRLLQKKALLIFGLAAFFFHAVLSVLIWLTNTGSLTIVDEIVMIALACAAILYFAGNRIPLRFQPAQVLLIAFLLWLILSCLSMTVTYGSDWVEYNATFIWDTAVSLLLAFPLGYALIREKKAAVGKALLHVLLLGWTVFIVYVLIHVFQGKSIATPNGGSITMYNASLRLNCSRNYTGAWELTFFLGSFLMLLWVKRLPVKILYGAACAVHFIALVLSNSRAPIYAGMLGFSVMAGIAVFILRKKTARRLLWAAIAAVLAGAAMYFLQGLIYQIYTLCAKPAAQSAVRSVYQDSPETFNYRTVIWKYAVDGIFTSFRCAMFGVSPKSIPELIAQMSSRKLTGYYTHNQFLEIAASMGIPGLCIFLAWLFVIFRDIYRLWFVQKERSALLAVSVLVLMLLLTNMMEAFLLFYDHFNGYIFFFLCGVLHGAVHQPLWPSLTARSIKRKKG